MNIIELNLKIQLQSDIEDLFDIGLSLSEVKTERTRIKNLGDYTTSVALILEKKYRLEPVTMKKKLCQALEARPNYGDVNLSGPGFINVGLSKAMVFGGHKEAEDFNGLVALLDAGDLKKLRVRGKRIKNILGVLETEGYLATEMQTATWQWQTGVDKKFLMAYHLSEALLASSPNLVDDHGQVLRDSLKDLTNTLEQIDNFVVYRKLEKDCLTQIAHIYCQIDQLFGKMMG